MFTVSHSVKFLVAYT